jgi:hypothetical protein
MGKGEVAVLKELRWESQSFHAGRCRVEGFGFFNR